MFSPDATELLNLAKAEARKYGNPHVYYFHILYVIVTTPSLIAHHYLAEHGFDMAIGKDATEPQLGSGNALPEDQEIEISESVRKSINIAKSQSDAITSMHILFGLFWAGLNSEVKSLFHKAGITYQEVSQHFSYVPLQVVKDFGNRFVRVSKESPVNQYARLLKAHRAVQFPSGSILLQGNDAISAMVIPEDMAVNHRICHSSGNSEWFRLVIHDERTDEEMDETMTYVMNFVIEMNESTDVFLRSFPHKEESVLKS